jgi:hypothetical protein
MTNESGESTSKKCPFCAETILAEAQKCKHCGEFLNSGQTGSQANAAAVTRGPTATTTSSKYSFPITVRSSPKALIGKYFWKAIFLSIVAILLAIFVRKAVFFMFGWGAWTVALLFIGTRALLDYLRIKNTRYIISPGKIEGYSYIFQWLGVANNAVNLRQLRQVKGYSNGMLDIWFFHCGKIVLTVSGDVSDFRMENIYNPGVFRDIIEEIAFGSSSVGMPGSAEAGD